MGGTIGLASQPGEGCTFSFTLPLADRAAGSDGSASIGERNAADAGAVSRPA
jgi:hypothetical protein